VIEAEVVQDELERVSPLLRHLMRTLIRRNKKKDELLATYANADFLPGIVSYAHLLSLMASVDDQEVHGRRHRLDEVSISYADVCKRCQAIAGHPRVHVLAMLKRMEKLNLIAVQDGRQEYMGNAPSSANDHIAGRQLITFNPLRIIESAERVGDHELDISIASELELIELSDLETLIGVDRQLILDKLSRAEIADDIFAFRRTKVLTYIEKNGVAYFSKKKARPTTELESLEDIDLIDDRTLFDAVSAFDTYDLAKLLAAATDTAVSQRLLSVMTKARQSETSWIMRRDLVINPLEIHDIEGRLVQLIKSIKAGPLADPGEQLSVGT
jgi:hypothetical protein